MAQKRHLRVLACGVLSGFAMSLFSGAPAMAAMPYCGSLSWGNGGQADACIYENSNYAGYGRNFQTGENDSTYADSHWYHSIVYPVVNDRVSSIWSESHRAIIFCEHANYGGFRVRLSPYGKVAYVGDAYNDRFSSHYFE